MWEGSFLRGYTVPVVFRPLDIKLNFLTVEIVKYNVSVKYEITNMYCSVVCIITRSIVFLL